MALARSGRRFGYEAMIGGGGTAQKQALFKAIAEGIHAATGLGVGDVFVSLLEVKRENWSFGNGVAQYAST